MMLHHTICDLVPGMTAQQYTVLRDDIRERGLLNEIVLYEGAILDGKHRHRACLELGIKPRFRTYEGTDPAGFVFSVNIAHRHLEKGQLAMAGAKLKSYYAEKAKERQGARNDIVETFPPSDSGKARDQAAAKVGVSGRSVDMAEHIIRAGVPELVRMVEEGAISLNQGHGIASLSKSRQQVVVDLPTAKGRTAAIGKSMKASHAKTRVAATSDAVPGTQLVRTLLSRLEIITNEISNSGYGPQEYAKQFLEEFDWSEPLLVNRLAHAQKAVQAISALSMIAERAMRKVA